MRKKKRYEWDDLADLVMRPGIMFRFFMNGFGRCHVPGCRSFAGRKRVLCRKHQGSPKWQRLAQRNL